MRKKEAFVFWNAGVCYVIDTWSREKVTMSGVGDLKGALYRANKKGYTVTVYVGGAIGRMVYRRLMTKKKR